MRRIKILVTSIVVCFSLASTQLAASVCLFEGMLIGQIKRNIPESKDSIHPRILPNDIKLGSEPEITITGLRIPSARPESKGYFIVFPGNSQLVRSIANFFLPVSDIGYDVYLFDYYGISSGDDVPGLEEIVKTSNIVASKILEKDIYTGKNNVFYGVSSGGIIALQLMSILQSGGTIILDSVPDEVPLPWCDSYIHPKYAIKEVDISKYKALVIHSKNDKKVVPYNSKKIINKVELNGGCHKVIDGVHPYEKGDNSEERVKLITEFLSKGVHSCE